MADRIAVNQVIVLKAFRDRLIQKVDGMSRTNCYVSLIPVPPILPPCQRMITVAPADGRFDPELHAGGGSHQTIEETSVIVTVFSRIMLDEMGKNPDILFDEQSGVMEMKRQVLRALKPEDELLYQGQPFLWNQVAPLQSGAPGYDQKSELGYQPTYFSADFQWDLT